MSKLHESIYYFQKLLLSSLRAFWMFLNNMCVCKSPCCHIIFIFSELLHNLILIKWNMVGKNNELFSERRERRFSLESENRTYQGLKLPLLLSKIALLHVPLPRKIVLLTRLFGTVQLKKTEQPGFHTRQMRLKLVLDTNLQTSVVPCHRNKIANSTFLQERISEAAICSNCKSSRVCWNFGKMTVNDLD